MYTVKINNFLIEYNSVTVDSNSATITLSKSYLDRNEIKSAINTNQLSFTQGSLVTFEDLINIPDLYISEIRQNVDTLTILAKAHVSNGVILNIIDSLGARLLSLLNSRVETNVRNVFVNKYPSLHTQAIIGTTLTQDSSDNLAKSEILYSRISPSVGESESISSLQDSLYKNGLVLLLGEDENFRDGSGYRIVPREEIANELSINFNSISDESGANVFRSKELDIEKLTNLFTTKFIIDGEESIFSPEGNEKTLIRGNFDNIINSTYALASRLQDEIEDSLTTDVSLFVDGSENGDGVKFTNDELKKLNIFDLITYKDDNSLNNSIFRDSSGNELTLSNQYRIKAIEYKSTGRLDTVQLSLTRYVENLNVYQLALNRQLPNIVEDFRITNSEGSVDVGSGGGERRQLQILNSGQFAQITWNPPLLGGEVEFYRIKLFNEDAENRGLVGLLSENYRVRYPTKNQIEVRSHDNHQQNWVNLIPNTTYRVEISSVNGVGESLPTVLRFKTNNQFSDSPTAINTVSLVELSRFNRDSNDSDYKNNSALRRLLGHQSTLLFTSQFDPDITLKPWEESILLYNQDTLSTLISVGQRYSYLIIRDQAITTVSSKLSSKLLTYSGRLSIDASLRVGTWGKVTASQVLRTNLANVGIKKSVVLIPRLTQNILLAGGLKSLPGLARLAGVFGKLLIVGTSIFTFIGLITIPYTGWEIANILTDLQVGGRNVSIVSLTHNGNGHPNYIPNVWVRTRVLNNQNPNLNTNWTSWEEVPEDNLFNGKVFDTVNKVDTAGQGRVGLKIQVISDSSPGEDGKEIKIKDYNVNHLSLYVLGSETVSISKTFYQEYQIAYRLVYKDGHVIRRGNVVGYSGEGDYDTRDNRASVDSRPVEFIPATNDRSPLEGGNNNSSVASRNGWLYTSNVRI